MILIRFRPGEMLGGRVFEAEGAPATDQHADLIRPKAPPL
jgi:hypothetical protein